MFKIMKMHLTCLFVCMFSDIHTNIIITEKQAGEIYDAFRSKTFSRFDSDRYVPLPKCSNDKEWQWENKDLPRVIAVLEFERFIKQKNISSEKGLAINGLDPEWEYIKHDQVDLIEYRVDKVKHDLHQLILEDGDYDFVMVNQTLEHVYDPITCLKNIYKYMKPGGFLYLNVPVNNIPHELPCHFYTGITPVGLGAIAIQAGFEIMSIDQWGNLEYLNLLQNNLRWPDYTKLEKPGFNDFRRPVIAWIFARKPLK